MNTTAELGWKMMPEDNGAWDQLLNKINNFHVLCVYNKGVQKNSRNHLRKHAKDIFEGKQNHISIFASQPQADTFFVWDDTYQANRQLFYKIRQSARDDLIYRISSRLGAYFLQEYAPLITSSMSSYPELKNKALLDKTIEKLETKIRQSTLLVNEEAWEKFISWMKYYLAVQVLQTIETNIGRQKLDALDQATLNETFGMTMKMDLLGDERSIHTFTNYTEQYLQHWIQQFIRLFHVDDVSLYDVRSFLEVKQIDDIHDKTTFIKGNDPLPLLHGKHISVMSNPVYQSVREALSNQLFERLDEEIWPTTNINQTTIEGKLQLIPFEGNDYRIEGNMETKGAIFANNISEIVVDVFDALCGLYLTYANIRNDIIEINLQDLLHIRGIKPKLSGNGRRGGFEKEQLDQIISALQIIESVWVNFPRTTVYEKGKAQQIELKARTFVFLNQANQICDIQQMAEDKTLRFTIGGALERFLVGSGRQIALLPLQTLHYHTYQEEWEKKISRYLSWRWRTQARKGDYSNPHKVESLLMKIGKKVDVRTPSRSRDRFERALDHLQHDGLIQGWEYVDWDESVADKNGWAKLWGQTKLNITPPQIIIEHYQSISKNKTTPRKKIMLPQRPFQENMEHIGGQLREFRKKGALTLAQVAVELELSPAYISMIERGKKTPSPRTSKQIEEWIQK